MKIVAYIGLEYTDVVNFVYGTKPLANHNSRKSI